MNEEVFAVALNATGWETVEWGADERKTVNKGAIDIRDAGVVLESDVDTDVETGDCAGAG